MLPKQTMGQFYQTVIQRAHFDTRFRLGTESIRRVTERAPNRPLSMITRCDAIWERESAFACVSVTIVDGEFRRILVWYEKLPIVRLTAWEVRPGTVTAFRTG